jgi:Tol biopolymer transport system component
MRTNILKALLLIAILAAVGFRHPTKFPQGVTEAERLLQRAMQKETVDGDLKAAIEQYKKIIARRDASRAVAAKALFQMGQCQEKLGHAEARKSYEQLVRDYADQADLAGEARARLAVLSKAAGAADGSTLAVRLVWGGDGVKSSGAVSPDGRFLSFADYDSTTANLAVRELATGKMRPVTNHKGSGLEHWQSSAFSPDGKQIAYICQNGWQFELRTIGIDGSNPRVLIGKEFWKEDLGYPDISPDAWAADGKQILVSLSRRDKPWQIALVSVSDGSVRILKTLDWRGPGYLSLSPDGRNIAYDFPQKEDAKERDIFLLPSDGGREIPLVQHPATDRTIGWTPDGRGLLYTSDRMGTMDLWFVQVDQGKLHGSPLLVKRDVGGIAPLGFTRDGSFYYGSSVGMEEIYIAMFDTTTGKILSTPAALPRRYSGGNLAPDWSPDGKYLAYSSKKNPAPSGANARVITIRSVDTGEERELSSKIDPRYNLRWSPDGRTVLVVGIGPENQPGAYAINVETGDIVASLKRAFWAEWARDGKTVFYLHNNPDKAPLLVRDLKTGQDKELSRDPMGSISVSPDGQWLAFSSRDSEGKTSMLNIMPASGGKPRELLRLKKPEDFFSITWTPDGRQLFFVRRFIPERGSELWRIAVEGGEPQNLGLAMNVLSQISIHPDGRRIAYNYGTSKSEVWVMENFLPARKSER